MGRNRWLFATVLAGTLGACTSVSTLSATEALDDLDAIVLLDETGGVRQIRYAELATRSAWYLRVPLFVPFRWLLRWTLPLKEQEPLEQPRVSARELVRSLPAHVGRDLGLCAATTTRQAWLAVLDESPETRVLAIDGIAQVARNLGLSIFAGSIEETCAPLAAERLNVALTGLRAASPAARVGREVGNGELEPYREALQGIVARPLDDWAARIILVDDLAQLLSNEHDQRARPWVEAALRAAIGHCLRGLLLDTVQRRDPQFAEVRLRAMHHVRALGGPAAVPLLLATMAASPTELARGQSRFDPDPLVQLRLIHYCGQLRGELADTVVRLPGRSDWEATSPAEFLARTVLNEQTYYSKLRTPAIVALTLCLARQGVDPDPAWVRQWLETKGG